MTDEKWLSFVRELKATLERVQAEEAPARFAELIELEKLRDMPCSETVH